ncbi:MULTISPECIES: ParB/RepB/Spo0J family partition protein [Clostridium]|uniref:Chromosome partitioning protein, ParB family n=1 Tax=Clostridium cadaveris TaxID=1529 RepID=A0A1I2NEJ8_9CLOT|nr:ParB/RepB/Spo0J family partition protein [Clostridium cadaveris]MDU4952604.1 ParB/RepB/Spo0J family partition protein [Clostridium sp.]MDM8312135.1 ParB/RepB/Spo0J family partition protein [Clostridium cadaveris]NME65580.1 ParB/RepB/Spo0J family partition protein [Clostridium cadaveris]PWL51652.1 MAG: ParB/RepB/Spo0J family partition protein [Clostridium cadaveris]UFH64999.1 ParB/RepB/Spo0J family partition protein [Clostridium cadaveris]
MSKKFALGKGLGALIPDDDLLESEKNNSESILKIDINLIKANEDQPRKYFDEQKIYELSQSIKDHGIIQPLILKKDGNRYIIIAGERRWRAAKLAGISEIPSILMDLSNRDVMEISLIENIQRQDLNPIEEAKAFYKLIKEFNLTHEELSLRIGKSRTAITNTMRLMNLDERVQQYIIEGVISEGHGRVILSIENRDMQYNIAQKVIDEGLSVRALEKLIKSLQNEDKNDKKEEPSNPYYRDITEKLEGLFGTKVIINSKKNKGKIEIEYYSEDDLQRIIDIMKI